MDGISPRRIAFAFAALVTVLAIGIAAFGAYCLWALEQGGVGYLLTIAPFGLALHRYSRCVDAGQGSAPEELLLGEPGLVALALAWAALFVLALN